MKLTIIGLSLIASGNLISTNEEAKLAQSLQKIAPTSISLENKAKLTSLKASGLGGLWRTWGTKIAFAYKAVNIHPRFEQNPAKENISEAGYCTDKDILTGNLKNSLSQAGEPITLTIKTPHEQFIVQDTFTETELTDIFMGLDPKNLPLHCTITGKNPGYATFSFKMGS